MAASVRRNERIEIIDDLERVLEAVHVESLHQFSERLRPHGLTIPQYLALSFIAQQGRPSTLTEVGAHIEAPPSTMTGISDRLVASGLVSREPHPEDRRSFRVDVTEGGRSLVAVVKHLLREDFEFMMVGLSDEDLEQFVVLIHHFQERLTVLRGSTRQK